MLQSNTSMSTVPEEQLVNRRRVRLLTVGDGDMTFSLALHRAYGKDEQIKLTATTLVDTEDELCELYPNSRQVLQELKGDGDVTVLFGVDATRLRETLTRAMAMATSGNNSNDDDHDRNKFDIIMFNHPHLGSSSLSTSESHHAHRHFVLLCHYLHAAQQCLSRNNYSFVHVCLCGTQPQTWNLLQAANKSGLELIYNGYTEVPVHEWLALLFLKHSQHQTTIQQPQDCLTAFTSQQISSTTFSSTSTHQRQLDCIINNESSLTGKREQTNNNDFDQFIGTLNCHIQLTPLPIQKHYKAPRKYRNGKLGSKHYLAKYGYQHRRTHGIKFGATNGGDDNSNVHYDVSINVEGSMNFVFRPKNVVPPTKQTHTTTMQDDNDEDGDGVPLTMTKRKYHQNSHHLRLNQEEFPNAVAATCNNNTCNICGNTYKTIQDLQNHLERPAMPDDIAQYVDPNSGRRFATLYGLHTYQKQHHNIMRDHENKNGNGHIRPGDTCITVQEGTANHHQKNNPEQQQQPPQQNDSTQQSDNSSTAENDNTSETESKKEQGKRQNKRGVDNPNTDAKWNGSVPPSSSSSSSSGNTVVVPVEHNNKRLRWYCRHAFPKVVKSKRQCDDIIKAGGVVVNDVIAYDSGRILQTGDAITIVIREKKRPISRNNNAQILLDGSSTHSVHDGSNDSVTNNNRGKVRIAKELNSNLVVAYKPVGIRTCGSFSSQTLEMTVSSVLSSCEQGRRTCTSLTKLETGCAGLCVLNVSAPRGSPSLDNKDNETHNYIIDAGDEAKVVSLKHTFTALVHGIVPEQWMLEGIWMELPEQGARRWKNGKVPSQKTAATSPTRKKETMGMSGIPGEDVDIGSKHDKNGNDEYCSYWDTTKEDGMKANIKHEEELIASHLVFIKCIERSKLSEEGETKSRKVVMPQLSTIQITTTSKMAGLSSTISYMLRKLNYPVVNDRFCKREYASLPRLMRNILKGKLSLGLYSVTVHGSGVTQDVGENKNDTKSSKPLSRESTGETWAKDVSIDAPRGLHVSYWERILICSADHLNSKETDLVKLVRADHD